MMGLIDKMEAKIQAARDYEIEMGIRLNRLFVAFNASGEMLSTMIFCLISPSSEG